MVEKSNGVNGYGRLRVMSFALYLGLIWGLYVLILGLTISFFPNLKFFWLSKDLVNGLAVVYPGYSPTILGSFIGFLWAVLCGAITGLVIGWLHNLSLEK